MAGVKHFTLQKYYELETKAREKRCFCIYLFMKVVLIKPKPLVHEGGTNSPSLSSWASFCPRMWTQQRFTWHIGIIRSLVCAPIEMTHCALPYWSGGLSSKWQLGVFFLPRLSASVFIAYAFWKLRESYEICSTVVSPKLCDLRLCQKASDTASLSLLWKKKKETDTTSSSKAVSVSPKASWLGCVWFIFFIYSMFLKYSGSWILS